MPVEVILPKVDMDMETGTIEAWKVSEGDRVTEGETIFEIGTNKAVMEVEAPASGFIRRIEQSIGVPIKVGTAVAWIYREGEAPGPEGDVAAVAETAKNGTAMPAGTATSAPVTHSNGSAFSAAKGENGLRATPLARRLARVAGIALEGIAGTGPRGRIGEADIRRHLESIVPAPVASPAAPGAASMPRAGEGGDKSYAGALVPFSSVRRIVAQRLSQSMREAPHFYLTAQIEMSASLALLKRLAPRFQERGVPKPSLTVFLAFVAARILPRHPLLNASVEGEAARLHASCDIGIAMERDGELVVPVIRDAGSRTLAGTATEFARLREATAARKLTPAEMNGGTFTISNLGMYGVDGFTAIINPPQSAILAVGRTVDTPVGRDGQVVLRPMATFTLSSDHRIVDGVVAARFMADLREALECPETLL